ncbi:MAG: hypothetical protein DHS80DRAFT_28903 [Piptocephalis tieghemiana]|nr:MAG: hypothetical protein DHS80DRAFT_28903 [Piptocephalis tieghemiana]
MASSLVNPSDFVSFINALGVRLPFLDCLNLAQLVHSVVRMAAMIKLRDQLRESRKEVVSLRQTIHQMERDSMHERATRKLELANYATQVASLEVEKQQVLNRLELLEEGRMIMNARIQELVGEMEEAKTESYQMERLYKKTKKELKFLSKTKTKESREEEQEIKALKQELKEVKKTYAKEIQEVKNRESQARGEIKMLKESFKEERKELKGRISKKEKDMENNETEWKRERDIFEQRIKQLTLDPLPKTISKNDNGESMGEEDEGEDWKDEKSQEKQTLGQKVTFTEIPSIIGPSLGELRGQVSQLKDTLETSHIKFQMERDAWAAEKQRLLVRLSKETPSTPISRSLRTKLLTPTIARRQSLSRQSKLPRKESTEGLEEMDLLLSEAEAEHEGELRQGGLGSSTGANRAEEDDEEEEGSEEEMSEEEDEEEEEEEEEEDDWIPEKEEIEAIKEEEREERALDSRSRRMSVTGVHRMKGKQRSSVSPIPKKASIVRPMEENMEDKEGEASDMSDDPPVKMAPNVKRRKRKIKSQRPRFSMSALEESKELDQPIKKAIKIGFSIPPVSLAGKE